MENSHQISAGDTLNIILFELQSTDAIHRGVWLSYVPATELLSIILRFQAIHKPELIKPFLTVRGVVTDADKKVISNDDADVYPFHSDTLIFDKKILLIDCANQNLVIEDRTISVTEGINYINNLFLEVFTDLAILTNISNYVEVDVC